MHRAIVISCALAACVPDTSTDDELEARKHYRDAASVDMSTPPPADAPTSSGTGGSVTCYSEGNPGASCKLPVHCCFTNYSSAHNGECTSNSCAWGTISCDGPEDCGGGQHCCAHNTIDPVEGSIGWTLSCQSSACGAPSVNEELCHPGGAACSNGGSCTSTYLVNNDLPRTLYICR